MRVWRVRRLELPSDRHFSQHFGKPALLQAASANGKLGNQQLIKQNYCFVKVLAIWQIP